MGWRSTAEMPIEDDEDENDDEDEDKDEEWGSAGKKAISRGVVMC
jgi:hypothetical protein